MSGKNKNLILSSSRRSFLKSSTVSALGLTHLNFLMEAIFQGALNTAHASENGFNKNYICITQNGAPPRWYFDLPFTPDGDKAKFVSCPGVGTRYGGSDRYTEVVYDTSLVNGIHMPWMWRFEIPHKSGGFVPMSELMDGMLIIRGTNSNNAAHIGAQQAHFRPLGIPVSLTALTADSSAKPIPGLNMSSGSYNFQSKKGLSPILLSNNNNMIKLLMQPFFEQYPTGYKNQQQKVEAALDASLNSLNKIAKNYQPNTDQIRKNIENAKELFSRDFGNLDVVYSNLYNKYKDLIDRSLDTSRILEGINDKPIGTTDTRDLRYSFGSDSRKVANDDLISMISESTHNNQLAQRFAVTEFVMLKGLSSSITFNWGGLSSLGTENGNNYMNYDEHEMGCMPSLVTNTYNSLAFSACLFEFISFLKDNNLYENTVIDINGEFGRNPQNDGGGSDHTPEGNSSLLMSGAIGGKVHVIGDIKAEATNRHGTWGYGADNTGYGRLSLGHLASSLAHIFGVDSPTTATPSLLKLEDGKFVPIIPSGKIVD